MGSSGAERARDPGPAQLSAQASDTTSHGYKGAATAPEITADTALLSEREDHLSRPP